MKKQLSVAGIQKEIAELVSDQETATALIQTAFKGLTVSTMKQAMLEAMMRGFELKNFLDKDIYAVPFGGAYSLVNSISWVRKVAMRSGIVGKTEPIYTEKNDKIETCTVTVKRKFGDYIGDFTATVYFSEYNTNQNQWTKKPRTMIAKVAEMAALRMACPEELGNSYVEEEFDKKEAAKPEIDLKPWKKKMDVAESLEDLKNIWAKFPGEVRNELEAYKNTLKNKLEVKVAEAPAAVVHEGEITQDDLSKM